MNFSWFKHVCYGSPFPGYFKVSYYSAAIEVNRGIGLKQDTYMMQDLIDSVCSRQCKHQTLQSKHNFVHLLPHCLLLFVFTICFHWDSLNKRNRKIPYANNASNYFKLFNNYFNQAQFPFKPACSNKKLRRRVMKHSIPLNFHWVHYIQLRMQIDQIL